MRQVSRHDRKEKMIYGTVALMTGIGLMISSILVMASYKLAIQKQEELKSYTENLFKQVNEENKRRSTVLRDTAKADRIISLEKVILIFFL